MKTRWAAFAASLVLLAGCPKDPRACNPACGDVPPSDVVDERAAERMDTYAGDVRDGDVRDGDVRDGRLALDARRGVQRRRGAHLRRRALRQPV